MDNHATTSRRIRLAFAAAGIVAATLLAATIKLGTDMADYLETSVHLAGATGETPQATQGAARVDAGEPPASHRAVAAAP